LENLEDAEIIQPTSSANITQEFLKCALLTEFRLNVEVKVVLPVIDVVYNVLRVRERLKDAGLT
jgi:hypothetical protein